MNGKLSPGSQQPAKTRFFIALLPPPDIQASATQIKEYFHENYDSRAALRSPPHITVFPPFQWADADLITISTALTTFAQEQPAPTVELLGFGSFPPRVIYIHVAKTSSLMALQAALTRYLKETLDLQEPARHRHRAFTPHLTVAFRDLKPAAFRRSWPEFQDRPFEATFTVPTLTLLRHDGQRWQVHQPFPFGEKSLAQH
jgi:2'-5' RNA ligase